MQELQEEKEGGLHSSSPGAITIQRYMGEFQYRSLPGVGDVETLTVPC